jgi:hypothetical protein
MTTLHPQQAFAFPGQIRLGRAVDTVINPHRRVSGAANGSRRGEPVPTPALLSDGQSLDGLIYLARLLRGQS